MTIVRLDPWREFDGLFNRVGGHVAGNRTEPDWSPALDISESESAFRIDLDVPAVAIEDIDVTVEEGVLTVSGERKTPTQEDHKPLRNERRYGKFSRRFRLPKNVLQDDIRASVRDGVLTVVLAKTAATQNRRIEIQAA